MTSATPNFTRVHQRCSKWLPLPAPCLSQSHLTPTSQDRGQRFYFIVTLWSSGLSQWMAAIRVRCSKQRAENIRIHSQPCPALRSAQHSVTVTKCQLSVCKDHRSQEWLLWHKVSLRDAIFSDPRVLPGSCQCPGEAETENQEEDHCPERGTDWGGQARDSGPGENGHPAQAQGAQGVSERWLWSLAIDSFQFSSVLKLLCLQVSGWVLQKTIWKQNRNGSDGFKWPNGPRVHNRTKVNLLSMKRQEKLIPLLFQELYQWPRNDQRAAIGKVQWNATNSVLMIGITP